MNRWQRSSGQRWIGDWIVQDSGEYVTAKFRTAVKRCSPLSGLSLLKVNEISEWFFLIVLDYYYYSNYWLAEKTVFEIFSFRNRPTFWERKSCCFGRKKLEVKGVSKKVQFTFRLKKTGVHICYSGNVLQKFRHLGKIYHYIHIYIYSAFRIGPFPEAWKLRNI